MAETQVTGRQIKDKSIFDFDIDLSTAPAHPSLVASDRIVIVDPTDGNIKTSTLTNLYTVLDSRYLLLTGGTVSGNLIVSGTTTLNAVTKMGTTMITNLNADMLDGYHASGFSLTSHTHNLTDGIFDGNGLLYRPYPAQPAIGSTPASGVFYSGATDPNSVGSVNFTGTMRAHVLSATVVFVGNYNAYLGGSGMTEYDNEYGLYHGSGDQIIALMGSDQGTDTYVYAGGNMIYNSSYFYFGGYVMSPRFHSTIGIGMPIQVASTTLCTNLNADLLDGNHASAFALSSHMHAYEPVIVAGTTAQYWRGDKTWQTLPSFPSIAASDTEVLFMSGANIVGSPGFNYNPFTGDFSAGIFAQAAGGNSCAIGTNAVAAADGCVAIGSSADSEGTDSICIGSSSMTFSNYCIILGVEATTNADNAIAIGRGAIADNAGDITLGSAAYNGISTIYGEISFPTLTSTGFLKITDGLVSVHTAALGTVTSVGLSLPSMFTVTESPVTTSGTLTATLASQTKNHVLVAPQFANGVPTFRELTADDIPDLSNMYDNYYSWNIQVGSGSVYQMLKTGSTAYISAYNCLRFLAGSGISITESSIVGGALGVTITSDIVSNTSSVVTYASSVAVATGGAFTAISSLNLPLQGTYLVLVQIMCSFTSPLNNVQAKIFNGSYTWGSTYLGSPLNDTTNKITTFWAIVQSPANNYVVSFSATASVSGASVISNTGLAVNGTIMSYIRLI
ncbi:MAG: hypothetical protein IPN08_05270 [Bacteroidales bacterium]|nr:hypothetical protein [Bacteroidales bacterium]